MVLRILKSAIAIVLALRILPSVIVKMYLGLRLLVMLFVLVLLGRDRS